MPNNFEEILSYSSNMPQTVGQATLELSQLLLREESGEKLSMDEERKKLYLMLLVQDMIVKKNSRTNISEYYVNRPSANRINANNNFLSNRRKSRRTKKAKRFHNND